MEPADDRIARALGDVLTEHLMREETVTVPGLGTFQLVHQPSYVDDQQGEQVMFPPADVIEFEEA